MDDHILIYPASNCGGNNLKAILLNLSANMMGLSSSLDTIQPQSKLVWILVGILALLLVIISTQNSI